MLAEFHERFGVAYHVSCHSMSSVGGMAVPDPGRKRSDFDIGTRNGTTTKPEFAEAVIACLSGFGYDVTLNEHFAGAESVHKHGKPAAGIHSLQGAEGAPMALYLDLAGAGDDGVALMRADVARRA